jgi:hypothetical protein
MCLKNNEAGWIYLCARTWQPKRIVYARQLFRMYAGGKEGEKRWYQGVSLTQNIYEHSKKRATNLHNFQKYVVRRTHFEYYDKGEFPTVKKNT